MTTKEKKLAITELVSAGGLLTIISSANNTGKIKYGYQVSQDSSGDTRYIILSCIKETGKLSSTVIHLTDYSLHDLQEILSCIIKYESGVYK